MNAKRLLGNLQGKAQRKLPNKQQGFTLLELIIVIAIIAIIATFALPSYTTQMDKTKRSAIQAEMYNIAGILANNYIQDGEYKTELINKINSDEKYSKNEQGYRINVELLHNGQGYIITATPKNTNDSCGKLTLDQNYNQQAKKETCW